MDTLFQLLKDILPLEIAGLIVVFLYFIKVFKDMSGEFVKISQQQAEYMKQRVESVDKTTSIYERTVQHQERDLKRMYELNDKMKQELVERKDEAVSSLDNQLNEIVKSIEEIKKDKLSNAELKKMQDNVEVAKINATRQYEEAISALSSIEEIKLTIDKAFVIMSYGADKLHIFDVIKKQLSEEGITVFRADTVINQGSDIVSHVRNYIDESDIIIADISERNPSVMYELGYAHGLGKSVILLTSDESSISFDLSNYRVIFYEKSNEGLEFLKEKLKGVIEDLKKRANAQSQMSKWTEYIDRYLPFYSDALKKLILN